MSITKQANRKTRAGWVRGKEKKQSALALRGMNGRGIGGPGRRVERQPSMRERGPGPLLGESHTARSSSFFPVES